jgi:hypothetical protein
MTPNLSLKEQYTKTLSWLRNNHSILYSIGFVLSILFAIGMIGYWFMVQQKLDSKSETLSSTSVYSLDSLQNDETIKDSFPLRKKLSDMLWYENQIDENIANTRLQRQRLSVPFDNFLNMLYTPTINIWRDPFSQKIDTSLIGKKYIENNPYWDITMIQQRTNFFKDVGVIDSYNTVSDVRIWQPEVSKIEWYFSIPVTVQFETPNKRSFLLLINKISMTAYIQNLSLINEFMYYVWETIKEEKQDILIQSDLFSGNLITTTENHDDRAIWYLLYNWIIKWQENKLISQDIIAKSIRKTAWCTTEEQQECMYMFREKMRALPYLAYGVAREGVDIIEWLKFFFKNIPPILSIETFSFEEKTIKKVKAWYKGTISLRIYGKDLLPEEINSISAELGSMCFLSKEWLSIANAKAKVEKNIFELGKWNLNIKRSTTLNQILVFITKIEKEYPTLPNQKKVVRLFELYRTLKENSLCDIIKTEEDIAKPIQDNAKITEQIIDFNDMSTDNINNIQIQTGSQSLVLTGNQSTGNQTSSWAFDGDRTIGDGKSKRDQQLANEFDTIEQE